MSGIPSGTGPLPLFGAIRQTPSDRILVQVRDDGQQGPIRIDVAVESSPGLPEAATSGLSFTDGDSGEPLRRVSLHPRDRRSRDLLFDLADEASDLNNLSGRDEQVNVFGHDDIGPEIDRPPRSGLG